MPTFVAGAAGCGVRLASLIASRDRAQMLMLARDESCPNRFKSRRNAVENDLIRPKPAAGRPEGRDRGRMRPLARNGRAGDWLRLEPGPPGQGGGAPLEAAIRTREDQDGHEF